MRALAVTTTIVFTACAAISAPASSQAQTATSAHIVDFDAAMRGLNFAPATLDGNLDATMAGNGIVDADEMALVSAILADEKLDLSTRGGVDHASVATAYAQAEASAKADFAKLASRYPSAGTVGAGYAMLGENSLTSYSSMAASCVVKHLVDATPISGPACV